tara:strand:- start:2986 stop:3861 length:876 start_codon:yes stop_codon:yes gene_type:complete
MQIAFHIGANCTDDDRILKSLLKNAGNFGEQGIKVPGPGKYRRLLRETIQNLNGAPPAANTRGILLDAIIDDDDAARVVLSNANFICIANRIFDRGIFYEQAEAKLSALHQLFEQDDIEIFLALRNPATFLPVVFAESKAETPEAYFNGLHPTQVRWSDLVRRIQHMFPQTKLTVWCNEDTPLIWAEILRAISGVEQDQKITGGFDLLASIMSDEGMNRFLNYLRSHPPKSEAQKRRIIVAFLDKYAVEEKIEETVDLPGMTDEMVDELSQIYDNDIEFIEQLPGVSFIAP